MDIPHLLTAVQIKSETLEKAKRLYQKRLAPDFNAAAFIGMDEKRISAVIAFLLDPRKSHGQGNAFLQALLKHLKLEWESDGDDNIQVVTEAPTNLMEKGNRYIDILVTAKNFALAIENKIWAADQDNQVSHYLKHLRKLRPQKHCIIYLTPLGDKPSLGSISALEFGHMTEQRKLVLLSYFNDIASWLSKCQHSTQSERVWSFIEDFSRHIKQQLKGVSDMEKDQIVQTATSTSDALASAFKIILTANDIKLELLRKLETQLRKELPPDRKLKWNLSQMNRYAGFAIEYQSIRGYDFSVSFESGRELAGFV